MLVKTSLIKKFTLYIFVLSCFSSTSLFAQNPSTPLGAIATQHPLASIAGARVLRAGGNAIDAAVAAALTLSVVEPYNSGIGAGGMAMIWDGTKRKAFALDFRETAPKLAHEKMFLQPGLPEDASRSGPLAIGVPGEIAGLAALHKRWGKLPWEDLFTEAIRYTEQGFVPDAALLARVKRRQDCLSRDYHSWKIYHGLFPNEPNSSTSKDHRPKPDLNDDNSSAPKLWRQVALAKTLKRLSQRGADDFYQGEIAQALAKDLSDKGSLIRLQDFQNYQVKWRRPLSSNFSWGRLWGFPLPSSGGISVIRSLKTLSALAQMQKNHETWIPWMVGVFEQIFKSRNKAMGDSDFIATPPVNKWISKSFARTQAKEILKKLNPPSPTKTGDASAKTQGHTSHLSVIDAKGNGVSMTITQNLSFGSCVSSGSTGILLNNQMDDFATHPGKANAFGLVQSKANAIAPGKRPLSSMSPTLVTSKKNLILAIGSPGGPRIISSVIESLYRYFVLGESLKQAVAAPRFHYQGIPHQIFVEKTASPALQESLATTKIPIKLSRPWSNVQAVAYEPSTQSFSAESDPRGIGKALVVFE